MMMTNLEHKMVNFYVSKTVLHFLVFTDVSFLGLYDRFGVVVKLFTFYTSVLAFNHSLLKFISDKP